MSKLDLVTVTNGQNISAMNSNFQAIEDYVNDQSLSRANPTGDANQMTVDLDMNGFDLLNGGSASFDDLTIAGEDIGNIVGQAQTAAAQSAASAASAQAQATASAASASNAAAAQASAAASAAAAAGTLANALVKTNNLSDVSNVATARTNLGVPGLAVSNIFTAAQLITDATNAGATFTVTNTGANAASIKLVGNGATTPSKTIKVANGTLRITNDAVNVNLLTMDDAGNFAFTVRPTFNSATPWDSANLNFASPPALGTTTPNTGAFSSITTSSGIAVDNTVASGARNITYRTSGSLRWNLAADATAESGGNVGSTFNISRYNDAGTFIDIPLSIARASGAVRIRGTQTNDSAAIGDVGEYLTATTGATGITNNTGFNATSISLTAGDWDVSGSITYVNTGGGSTAIYAAISTTSATIGSDYNNNAAAQASGATVRISTPVVRISLASTTTVYLTGLNAFAAGTATGAGTIRARRIR